MKKLVAIVFVVGLVVVGVVWQKRKGQAREAVGRVNDRLVLENGGRVDWSGRNEVATDRRGSNGFYDVYVMKPEGGGVWCVTCGGPALLHWHKGNPAWYPAGDYIVFEGQTRESRLGDELAAPGKGINNDLWLVDGNGTKFWRLTDLSGQLYYGVLHPHFSHDGRRLVWAQFEKPGGKFGMWSLKIADFGFEGGQPRLTNIQTLRPGKKPRFYESHGFTADGRKIIFSSNSDEQKETGLDIYIMDSETGQIQNLTNSPDEWDEHAQISPDGTRIVWSSDRGQSGLGHELWTMNVDGTNKRRLTDLRSDGFGPGDSAWSPDGMKILVYVIGDSKETGGDDYLLEGVGGHGI